MRGRGEGTYSFSESEQLFTWRLKVGDRSLVRKAKTQKELRAKVKVALNELDQRGGIASASEKTQTVAGWLNVWLETYVQPHRAPKTYRQYEQLVRLYMIPAIGSIRLQALKGHEVQAMLNAMMARGLSSATVSVTRVVLKRSLSVALKLRLILSNPADATERVKVPTRSDRAMSVDQLHRFIDTLKESESRYAALLLFIIGSGVRINEALGLKESDVQGSVVHIHRQLVRDGVDDWSLAPLKTAKSQRRIPLSSTASLGLSRAEAIRDADRQALKDLWPNTGLVFTSATGQPMIDRNVQRALDGLLVSAGLPHFSHHDLRRTFATTLVNQNAPVHILQAVLGHESVETTLKHYLRAFDSDMAAAVEFSPKKNIPTP